MTLSLRENSRIGVCSNRNMFNLENADDVVVPSEDQSKLRVFPDRLDDNVWMFVMLFAPLKCKML